MRLAPLVLAALAACADPSLAHARSGARSGPWSLELLDGAGNVLPTFRHRGRTYVLGALGERYQVRVRNGSGQRVEVVVSVDGRDVVDGRPAAYGRRGYVVDPWGSTRAPTGAGRCCTTPASPAWRRTFSSRSSAAT